MSRRTTMSRLQLALNVDDLEKSVEFYSRLFSAEPAKVRPGYANFAIADPPLKLVLMENPGHGGSLNHLGVEVEDVDTVDAQQTRLAASGLASVEERDTTCCYAKQDKFWVEGAPNGERWEIYTVLEDSESFGIGDTSPVGCCGDEATGERALRPSATACC
jgi:catechol 2,3-dioxygenase-like lactoylglutathione lyase family enzyme